MSGIATPSYPLRIVTGATMAEIDRVSIDTHGIPGETLMERAGELSARLLIHTFPTESLYRCVILCGKGNNGGDGFVIARHLFQEGLAPVVLLFATPDDLKGDARTNAERLQSMGVRIETLTTPDDLTRALKDHANAPLWIDALLGTGTTGAPRGLIGDAVRELNRIAPPDRVVAIDIPTGVNADTGDVPGEAVHAGLCITMGLPKVGHALPPGHDCSEEVAVLDIGFPQRLLHEAESPAEWLTPARVNPLLPRYPLSTHKGTRGHLLVIAGSRGMTGAALLCASAAVETGAGLVTALCPASLQNLYASSVWEMMTVPTPETDTGAFHLDTREWLQTNASRFSAIAIGPGLGQHESTAELVRWAVAHLEQPLIVDGDGLNALNASHLQARTHPWVATPHPGEMARLLQTDTASVQADRWAAARKLATPHGAVILKGPRSVIAQGDTLRVNPTGTPAMASGGMGDTLTGMTGALLAQGLTPLDAACCATWLHGAAAQRATQPHGAECIPAHRVIKQVGAAVGEVRDRARFCPRTTIERYAHSPARATRST